jgi:hypothetical protein
VRTFLLMFAVLSALWLSNVPFANAAEPLSVTASLVGGPDDPSLEFVVKNNSAAAIEVPEPDLPWSHGGARLILVPAHGEPLPGRITTEDYFRPPQVRTIRTGEVIRGRVRLLTEFQRKDVEQALRSCELILFWYYAPGASSRVSLGEYGGWLTLSQKVLPKPMTR